MGVRALEAALVEDADYPDELSVDAELIERDSTARPRA
jgi:LacI family transcriptional regulator